MNSMLEQNTIADAPPGYICGFRFAGGRASALSWQDACTLAGHSDEPNWVHLGGDDPQIQHWLDNLEALPVSAREFLTGDDLRPRIHMTANFVYGVIADLEIDAEVDVDKHKGTLRFYFDAVRMITVRGRPLQSTDRLRHQVLDGDAFEDTVELFASLIRGLNEGFAEKVNGLGERLDDVEEGVLEGRHADHRAALGSVRRELVEIKRYVDPERTALAQLVARRIEWADPRSAESLVQAIQALNSIGGALEGLYERAKLLQEEVASLLAEDINRKLLALSIMSALLLPATLISGVFGMNVAGLPGMHQPHAFWIVTSVMAVLGLLTVAILKRMRLW